MSAKPCPTEVRGKGPRRLAAFLAMLPHSPRGDRKRVMSSRPLQLAVAQGEHGPGYAVHLRGLAAEGEVPGHVNSS